MGTLSRTLRAAIAVAACLFVVLFASMRAVAAEPAASARVPEPLRAWVPWVLYGKEDALCPVVSGGATTCAWPTRVELDLGDKGGTFTQSWRVDARRIVPLPGDARRWPEDVKVDGKAAVVLARDGRPGVELAPGIHELKGRFLWDSMPESLQVPPESGLVALTVRGKRVELPQRDAAGMVWLQKAAEAQEGDAIEIVVHRRVEDDVPLQLVTRIQLAISGKSREIVLGRALPPELTIISIDAQLPARVEPDSRLRVQARPGTYVIELTARSEGRLTKLARPTPGGPWRDGEEVWVFAAHPDLRVVDVEGVSAIDPQQTSLPDAWRKLPAYPMKLGDEMRFLERRRGDADPPPDRLTLDRELWLDFDGGGMTLRDRVAGTMSKSTRLEMLAPIALGRVAIRDKDQLITRLRDGAGTGVEIRVAELSVVADARYAGDPSDVPAIGWNHDFARVAAKLHVPPGFRLVHATGVDEVPGTWLRHWTLMEIFLVIVFSAAVARLYGLRWGALALATMVLALPEGGAPRWVWAFVLAAEAIVRLLPEGTARRIAGCVRLAAVIALAIIAIPFVVTTVREGLHPALERRGSDRGAQSESGSPPSSVGVGAAAADKSNDEIDGDADSSNMRKGKAPPAKAPALASSAYNRAPAQLNVEVYDPNAMVQTGPGLPSWTWTEHSLRWSGPVDRGQRLHLFLLRPAANLILALVRAALLFALVLRMVPFFSRDRARRFWRGPGAVSGVLLALATLASSSGAVAAEVPPADMLEELQKRLLAPPACMPDCVAMPRMVLDARGKTLRARIAIDVGARIAVPLPGGATQWLPERVDVDGKPATALLLQGGKLFVALDPGSHEVIVEGRLADRETVQIPLPLRPQRVEATLAGWKLDGLHEDGLVDESLQLTRIHTDTGPSASLEASTLPPFVRVERTLRIGLAWQVETKVVRASPAGAAVVLEIPLLAGESVTTADVRAVGGKVLVNLAPNATETSWRSVLETKSPLTLVAPKGVPWVEVFRLDLSPIWHATFDGIPPVHPGAQRGAQMPEWRPWPGESVIVAITRPDGVAGQTLTIDRSTLDVRPGLRSTDTKLSLGLRSSRGGQHALTLPEGAVLESLAIGGAPQPIRQEGRKVAIPITPGAATVELAWRTPTGIATMYRVAPVDLGLPTVNASVNVFVSDARWTLFLGGPRLGPAVLFWGLLAVLLVVAVALGRVRTTPLGTAAWLLLAIGLSQIPIAAALVVVGWLLVLGHRKEHPELSVRWFQLRQIALALWSIAAVVCVLEAVHHGLLGQPDMQIEGNESSATALRWFRDRGGATTPEPWIFSLPTSVYRFAMLAWASWLALSLLRWLKWGWGAFATGGLWRRAEPTRSRPAPLAVSPTVPPIEPSKPSAHVGSDRRDDEGS